MMIAAAAVFHSASLFSLQLLILFVIWRRYQSYLIFLFVSLIAIGSFYYFSSTKIDFKETGEEQLTIHFFDRVKMDGRTLKGLAKTDEGDILYTNYTFQTEEEKKQFEQLPIYAYSFEIQASFEEIPPTAHPYAFNMGRYLQMNGAKGIIQIDEITAIHDKDDWTVNIAVYRERVLDHIERTFPSSLVAEAKALLVGDRSDMSEETAAQYRKLGITHLFAISGLHVGLLTFIVRECLLRCRMRKEYVDMLLFCALPIYAMLVGGAPSVWRASVVTMLILCVKAFKWRVGIEQLLAVTCILFILIKPYNLLQPGFQLSYGATFALIFSSQILIRTTSYWKQSFLITAISQIALYPVLLVHFYEVSISSFLVNLLFVPLYSIFILPMNIVLLLVSSLFAPFAKLLFFIYEPLRGWIETMTIWIAELPYQLWTPGKPHAILLAIAVVGIGLFFVSVERRQPYWRSILYLLIPAFLMHAMPYVNGELRVSFVDVGQGDCIVIELPYRRGVYVIDAGGMLQFGEEKDWRSPSKPFEIGRNIVVPFLKGRGITTIHAMILSHPHVDHIGGVHEVMEDIRVRSIHTSPNTLDVPEMQKIIEQATNQQIPIEIKKNEDRWIIDDTIFYYMGPQEDRYEGNDSSLILFMQSRGYAFLFAGDIEEKGERQFVSTYGEMNFPPTILKVAHHGSKTSSSSAFLDAVQPIIAVAMQGRNNRFNHPSEEVVERFKEKNIPLFTTQQLQTITIKIDRNGKLSIDHQ